MKSNTFKEYIAPVVVLVAICLVVTGLLAFVNSITAPIIEANSIKAANEARAELLPAADTFTAYEGKLAVGSVVMNRVKSSYFPNTISGVIYQKGQFSPVASGRYAYRLQAGVNSECLQAAQEVLDGKITLNCLFFRTNNGIVTGTVIGNHVFY